MACPASTSNGRLTSTSLNVPTFHRAVNPTGNLRRRVGLAPVRARETCASSLAVLCGRRRRRCLETVSHRVPRPAHQPLLLVLEVVDVVDREGHRIGHDLPGRRRRYSTGLPPRPPALKLGCRSTLYFHLSVSPSAGLSPRASVPRRSSPSPPSPDSRGAHERRSPTGPPFHDSDTTSVSDHPQPTASAPSVSHPLLTACQSPSLYPLLPPFLLDANRGVFRNFTELNTFIASATRLKSITSCLKEIVAGSAIS